jgi:cardiolipin synthase
MAGAPTLSSPLRPLLYKMIRDARKSITMTMAYFAPDDELIDLLCAAGMRGVRVRLMFATKSDAHLLVLAARSFYHKLLAACCEVYEREGAMLHQKSIAVDGVVSVLGSTNLDYRSIEFNLELSAVIRSEEFARQLNDMFDNDVKFSRRIETEKWKGRPYGDRVVQWAVNRMRYLL